MPERENNGRKTIEEVQRLRARVAKLERIALRKAGPKDADRELDRAWSEWETTFDAIGDSVILLDSEFNIVQANAATSSLLGKPLDEIVGQKCYKLVHGSYEPLENCPLVEAQSTRNRQKEEFYIAEKGIWAIVSADPILDEQGNLTGAVHIIRDITERKKAEDALRESEDRFRNIFDNALLGIYRTTPEGQILMANPALVRMLGYESFEQLAQRNLEAEGYEPSYLRSVFKDRVEREGQLSAFEAIWVRRNGEKIHIVEHARAVRDAHGNTLYYEGTVEDITERKKAEQQVRQSEQKYKELFESAREAIIIMDLNGKITDANRIVEEYGHTRDYLLGKSIFDFIPVNHRARAARDFDELCHGTPVKGEMEVIGPKGNLTMEYRDNPIVREGQIVAVQAILMDITEQKRAEQALRDYQARLKSLASELSLTEERERRRIAEGIHDGLGQKLALAKMELQLLARSPGKSKIPASLDGVCARIDEAIKDAHSLTFELSNPALYDLSFEAAVDLWLLEQIEKKHGIKCTVIADEQAVPLDENSKVVLFRVLRELAVNVVKHAKATALTIAIEKLENSVQITCKDDGLGFAPPEGGAAALDAKGGFGLFNIKERLEYLGGSMKLQSAPGRGTLITLSLPASSWAGLPTAASLPLKRQNAADADEGRQ